MAITKAQQVRQMLNGGGAPSNRGDIGKDEPSLGVSLHGGESVKDAVRRGELKAEVKRQEAEKREELVERFRNKQFRGSNLPGFIGMGLNLASPLVQKGMTANRNFFLDKVLPSKNFKNIDFTSLSPSKQDQLYSDYMSARLSGEIDAFGNPLNQDDDDSSIPLFPLTGIMAQAPSGMDQEPEIEEDEGLRRRFRAEGGIMNNDVVGGEFDFESARQMYGLGKLVKKVTRTVKKIAKSPIGKAALLYAGTAGLGALGAGAARAGTGFGIFAPSNVLSNVGTSFLRFKGSPIGEKIFGKAIGDTDMTRSGGLLDLIGGKAGAAIIGTSLLAGLTAEQKQEVQDLVDNSGFSLEEARNSVLARARDNYKMDVRARGFRAEGGPAEGKEPVAKKTMPLLDMGGQEMDLRAEGGFVPIGRMEKADDVPARLSKNEFVFTADAVRNAGDGDVDKGAEVMYNMMKNLEAGGEVSEESQGLEGARKMFQTSQRLEEVL